MRMTCACPTARSARILLRIVLAECIA
jgi:hypothetical protein